MPERCCPGRFDYIGSSHQLWHLMVVASLYYWYSSSHHLLEWRTLHACPVPDVAGQPPIADETF